MNDGAARHFIILVLDAPTGMKDCRTMSSFHHLTAMELYNSVISLGAAERLDVHTISSPS